MILLIFYFVTICVYGQKDYGEIVKKYGEAFPFEKIFLHTDKPYYFPSDTIWFKAYATNPSEGLTQSMSPSVPLYVELISPSILPIAIKKVIKLTKGKGHGDFVIPRDLKPGVYKLRAYTTYSMNFGEQAFFERNVFISDFGHAGVLKGDNSEFKLSLYPEGGAVLAGNQQNFAIRSVDENGNGIPVSGILITENKDTLCTFRTDEFGLGKISFKPVPYLNYEIQATNQFGFSRSFAFSELDYQGYSLEVDLFSKEDFVKITVWRADVNTSPARLFQIQNGSVLLEIELEFEEDKAIIEYQKKDLPSGLLVFKLVENGFEPIAERLIYLEDGDIEISIVSSKKNFAPKDKVELEILLSDVLGNPEAGEFSISVTDAKQVPVEKRPANIKTYTTLTSELVVKQPFHEFPFSQEPEKLDNYLISQSWRSFLPDIEILKNEKSPYNVETGLSILGEVTDNRKEGSWNLRLILIDKDGYPEIMEGHTDEEGRFVFLGMDFQDTVGVYIQSFQDKQRRKGNVKELKMGNIQIHETEKPPIKPREKVEQIEWRNFMEGEPYLQHVNYVNGILRRSFLMQEYDLEEFVVKGNRAFRSDPRTIAYNNNPDIRLRVPEEVYNYFSIIELLNARALRRGLAFTPDQTYLIDGNFAPYPIVASLRVSDIEFVDIILGRTPSQLNIGGRTAYNILTKEGNPNFDWSAVKVEGTKGLKLQGYAPTREFFIPPDKQDINSPISLDFRSTVYWNPSVNIDQYGKALVSFPLSDGATIVHVEVQGISDKGVPFYGTYQIEVRDGAFAVKRDTSGREL